MKNEGIAGMRIVSDQLVEYHMLQIKVGIKRYFMEGLRRAAESKVIELGERLRV